MRFGNGVLLGVVLTLVVLVAGAYLYFDFGWAPVATAAPPMPFEKFLANRGLHAAIGSAANTPSPVPPTEANFQAGAEIYRQHCAVCHGLPGQEMTAIGKGEFPKPPHLFKGKGVSDDPVGETFWKVKNGIRLTGMPGFQGSLSDTQMWQVSELLANSNQLPAAVQQKLAQKQSGTE